MKNKRLIIYPKDVARITGKSLRTGSKWLQKIKEEKNKSPEQLVTVPEFCEYTGLREEDVFPFLR